MDLNILAVNLLVGAILVLNIICAILLLIIRRRGVWRAGYVTAPLAVTLLWAVWAMVSLYYRNIYAGGLPSLFVSTLGAVVQIMGFTVLALILWSIYYGRYK